MTAKEKLFTSLWLYDTREFQIKQPSKQQKEEKKKKEGRKEEKVKVWYKKIFDKHQTSEILK